MLNIVRQGTDTEVIDATKVFPADAAGEADFGEMATTMLTLAKRIRVLFGLALADAGYHNGQDHLLTCLVPGETVAVSALASTLDVRPSTVSKMLDRLSDKGLVERRQVDRDKRVTLVCLTPDGEDAQKEIRDLWANVCRQVAAGLQGDKDDTMRHLQNVSGVLATRLMKLR
jgi:DNA-binding MarR family transcriptional regulator